jgi:hypothetical protein
MSNRHENHGPWPSWIRTGATPLLIGLAVILLLGSVLIFPQTILSRDVGRRGKLSSAEIAKAKNDVRTTLLQGIGGLLLIIGAVATWRQLRINQEQLLATREQMQLDQRQMDRQQRMSEDAQTTERFTRAIEQLGNESVDVRVGGIYSLGRIADNSAKDAGAIFNVLTTYVRFHSPWPPARRGQSGMKMSLEDMPDLRVRAPDIQAVMTVIAGRSIAVDQFPVAPPSTLAELARQVLLLRESDLRKALLIGANLQGVHLTSACLQGSELTQADLRFAELSGSDLRGANLQGAQLEGTILVAADLRGAMLEDASLSGAKSDHRTKWPDYFDPVAAGVNVDEATR